MRKDIPGLARRIRINEPAKRRSPSPVISTGRHRLGGADPARSAELPPRFPITRQGYDRAVVDERFAELEQEVFELEQELIELDRELVNVQAPRPPKGDAAAEVARTGEQVSAVLIAAHESADETKRLAEGEADRHVADAETRARSITEDPNRELRRLQEEMASLERERDRLLRRYPQHRRPARRTHSQALRRPGNKGKTRLERRMTTRLT
jgi:DivIVA protein